MTDPLPRFMVRRGSRGYMVWDRVLRGPAQINGRLLIGLAKEEADEIRDQLQRYFATNIGEK
jgi:hypothetical protein